MENLDIWNKYKQVPKNALKEFNNGRFSGTDINTMWRMKSLTESFGICGVGWYYKPVKLWTEKCDNNDIFAFAEIELFIKVNGEWSMGISGTGGNKLVVKEWRKYPYKCEAFKMAITDAIGVACKNLGLGADVYWENDKTKYTEQQTEKPKPTKTQQVVEALKGTTLKNEDVAVWIMQKLGKQVKVEELETATFKELLNYIEKKQIIEEREI